MAEDSPSPSPSPNPMIEQQSVDTPFWANDQQKYWEDIRNIIAVLDNEMYFEEIYKLDKFRVRELGSNPFSWVPENLGPEVILESNILLIAECEEGGDTLDFNPANLLVLRCQGVINAQTIATTGINALSGPLFAKVIQIKSNGPLVFGDNGGGGNLGIRDAGNPLNPGDDATQGDVSITIVHRYRIIDRNI
jgi:hypothetical protein